MITKYFRCLILFLLCSTCLSQQAALAQNHIDKHKGIHFFDQPQDTTHTEFQNMQNAGLEWVTLVPFASQEYYNSTDLYSGAMSDGGWDRHDLRLIDNVKAAKKAGFKVMLKPHIWISHKTDGKWRSEIQQDSPQASQAWSVDYRAMILHYAEMSELMNVDLFCVGMELQEMIKQRPHFWVELIREVREIYSGELVYAANWYEEFEQVTFWDKLDYIGVQGYFPLTEKTNPSVKELKRGWKKFLPKLQRICQQYDKPLLFTEMGYKSTSDAAIEPWQWVEDQPEKYQSSYQTQANCYEAFFQTFWAKPWFAGAHFWQWRVRPKHQHDIRFSPQGKPAEKVLREWF